MHHVCIKLKAYDIAKINFFELKSKQAAFLSVNFCKHYVTFVCFIDISEVTHLYMSRSRWLPRSRPFYETNQQLNKLFSEMFGETNPGNLNQK